MSWLEIQQLGGISDFFDSAAEGWGPFTFLSRKEQRKGEKDLAKIALQQDAQTFQQQQDAARAEAEREALEEQRRKTVQKLKELEAEALTATALVMKIRELASDPRLEGDASMDELEEQLLDLEKAVVGIQASTVVDTATFDTQELAEAYSNGQAALIAMRTISARANGILNTLDKRIAEIEQQRAMAIEAARREEEQRRQAVLDRQRQEEEAARRRRMELIRQIMEVDKLLADEKNKLRQRRMELATLRSQREQQAQELAARRAAIAQVRAG